MYKTELQNTSSNFNNVVKKLDRKFQSVSKVAGYPLGNLQNYRTSTNEKLNLIDSYIFKNKENSTFMGKIQEPTEEITKLKNEIEYWEIRYNSLEKQYSSMLSMESKLESQQREIQDQQLKFQYEKNQSQIIQRRLEEKVQLLEKEKLLLQENISGLNLKLEDATVNFEQPQVDSLKIYYKELQERNHDLTDQIQKLSVKERGFQKQIQNFLDEIGKLHSKLNQFKDFENLESQLEKAIQDKNEAEKCQLMKAQEFEALKQITKEKEETILQQNQIIQSLKVKIDQIENEKTKASQTLLKRSEAFDQFKMDVEKEVQKRIQLLALENQGLTDALKLKTTQVQKLNSLKQTVEHYQKEYVKTQLENENLTEALNDIKKQQNENDIKKQQEFDQKILEINCNNQQIIDNLKERLKETEKARMRSDQIIRNGEMEYYQAKDEAEDWKQRFIKMNKDFHQKQEEIKMLQTEVQALERIRNEIIKKSSVIKIQ